MFQVECRKLIARAFVTSDHQPVPGPKVDNTDTRGYVEGEYLSLVRVAEAVVTSMYFLKRIILPFATSI